MAATTTELKLRAIFDLNAKLRKANKGTVSLLPLYSLAAKYITLDTTGLFDLLKERERHKQYRKTKKGCERCKDCEPFKRSETNVDRFLWQRMGHWLKYFAIPDHLLLAKDKEAVPGRAYFNSMIMTDG
ncbi:hypothetical protein H4R27_006377, partial [Coemansia aciculifera]